MLEAYKQAYVGKNIQLVLTNLSGDILESDQNLIPLGVGSSIFNVDPFFECLSSIQEIPDEEVIFNCVHLNILNTDIIVDIVFAKKKDSVLIALQDYTEHYTAYQSMAQARNESIINEELIIIKNNELEERERFKNKFIQNFSHELRNPLTSIIAITNIIGDTNLNDEQLKMVDFLKDSNINLKLMLEDVLSISMIASGRVSLVIKTFSFSKFIDLLMFTYTAKAEQKGLKFVSQLDEKLPEFLEGDRLRLFQIITNLLDNALKYTQKGTITLEVQLNQKRANKVSLHFIVSDTGAGIEEGNMTSVFESFKKYDTVEKQDGTGLGLSIVKGLLELMDSQIQLESVLGKGSTFYFDLVLKYPLHPVTETLSKSLLEKKKHYLKPKGKDKFRLLLVEDDERIQTILFKYLMETNSFYIDLVSDGSRVMERLINTSYDIILMDINLPNVTGDQITRLIRDFPFNNINHIPIIGITAHAYKEQLKNYKNLGMNVVLSKPFEKELLIEAIFNLLK